MYYVLVVTNCLIVYCIYYLSCAAVLTVNKDDYFVWPTGYELALSSLYRPLEDFAQSNDHCV